MSLHEEIQNHKTKEELCDWVLDNVGDGNPYYDLNLLAEEIWDMKSALKEGNKKLKEENSMLRDLLQDRMPVGCIAETTYQPILEENEKLKNEIKDIKEDGAKIIEQLGDELHKEYLIPLRKENKKLKQENYTLRQDEIKEIKELKEIILKQNSMLRDLLKEAEENQKKMNYYQFYVYTIDGGGDCDFKKEDVDQFTDDQKLREYLYEEIGYEADEDTEE
tara:strand:+ start:1507 stop:2166 length:660 start_codon:yes stop_codon:yes gene_type:complete